MIRHFRGSNTTYFLAFLSILISFSSLFMLGSLGELLAYDDPTYAPLLKKTSIQIIAILIVALSSYYTLKEWYINKKPFPDVAKFILISLAVPLSVVTGGSFDRVEIGDYLRDVHWVNIYFMDEGGWIITSLIVFFFVYLALLTYGYRRLSKKRMNK